MYSSAFWMSPSVGCLHGLDDAVHAVPVGLELGVEHVLPLRWQSRANPYLRQRTAVLLDEGQRMAVVVQPVDVAAVPDLPDGRVVLVLDGVRRVTTQHHAVAGRCHHHRQLGTIGLPDGRHLEALARAVRGGGGTHAHPPAIELAGLRVDLILQHVEGLLHLFIDALLRVYLRDELVELAHVRPAVVVPLEVELAVVHIIYLYAVAVVALWLLAGIQQGERLADLHLQVAPARGQPRRLEHHQQPHGVSRIFVLVEARGAVLPPS